MEEAEKVDEKETIVLMIVMRILMIMIVMVALMTMLPFMQISWKVNSKCEKG